MVEQKAPEKPKGYFVGQLEQQTQQGILLVDVIAKPDGTAMTQMHVDVELLNKLDAIFNLIKSRL